MKLITSTEPYGCVAASIAMLLGVAERHVKEALFYDPPMYPFSPPWDKYPLVPSMDVICDWLICENIALTPFQYAPRCTPHPDCPPVNVWSDDDNEVFEWQLARGPGLIEGSRTQVNHMCAWNGEVVYDPSGHIYDIRSASRFNFKPVRFWLASHVN